MAKKEMSNNAAGLSIGIIFGVMHLLWVFTVSIGIGEWLIKWLHSVHFINHAFSITNVVFINILIGLVGAFASGYVIGWAYSWLYNRFA